MARISNDNSEQLIKRYLNFDLSPEELEQFQYKLENDTAFGRKYRQHELTEHVLDTWMVGNRKTDGQANQKTAIPRLRWMLGVAAMVLFVLFAMTFTKQEEQIIQQEEPRIFAAVDNYARFMSEDILRGETTRVLTPGEERLKAILLQFDEQTPKAMVLTLSQFVDKDTVLATKELAEWWLANAHLRNGEILLAKEVLEAISEQEQYNSARKANQKLKLLDSDF